ncbi:MAG: bifunctional (p)ppGpp synthetase/guanosine-3',5'-bis(diphosphate) 3'-pyrophosphohydrolase [Magnetococcales bacterium]|nr:bifunctional (p)ppGpp synthetase/guanosine-3',5'-bis(diphosphate) 3'-pyrophosphohydrolase [Magnetococcales bacterium]
MATLEAAIALAVTAHKGQVDKVGQPYILHPLRLMLRLDEEEERIVAVLHDVVEDTDVTLDDLRAMGFSPMVIDALDRLTHRPEESYDDYLQKILPHPLARKVKLLDLEDNMDIRRLDHQCLESDWIRLKKYRTAWARLRGLPLA